MDDFKGMLASRTVWAGLIGFIAVVLDMFGIHPDFDQNAAVDAILKLVEAVSFLGAIIFRVVASKRIA